MDPLFPRMIAAIVGVSHLCSTFRYLLKNCITSDICHEVDEIRRLIVYLLSEMVRIRSRVPGPKRTQWRKVRKSASEFPPARIGPNSIESIRSKEDAMAEG